MALHPPLSTGPADPAQEEHLLLMLIATDSRLLLNIRTFGFASVYIWSQNVCWLPTLLLPGAFCLASSRLPRGLPVTLTLSAPRVLRRAARWLCCASLLQKKKALASLRWLLAWPEGDSDGGRAAGPELDGEFAFYASCRQLLIWPGGGCRSSDGGAARRGVCFLCLSLPTLGPVVLDWPGGGWGQLRGAQLDGGPCFQLVEFLCT